MQDCTLGVSYSGPSTASGTVTKLKASERGDIRLGLAVASDGAEQVWFSVSIRSTTVREAHVPARPRVCYFGVSWWRSPLSRVGSGLFGSFVQHFALLGENEISECVQIWVVTDGTRFICGKKALIVIAAERMCVTSIFIKTGNKECRGVWGSENAHTFLYYRRR